MPVQAESDYSYGVRQIVDDGYVAIGDAAGFLDPIFSSGVFLAMATAEKVAEVLTPVLAREGPVRASDLAGYERFARKGFKRFREFVVGFYDPGFRDTFYQNPPLRALVSSVTSILAGAVFDPSSGLRWWSRVFLFFARLESWKQRRAAAKG
jgi:2-polyprenyl-6-methoxyphenol hydroxylase-like FAD-dependent oxidoreductase